MPSHISVELLMTHKGLQEFWQLRGGLGLDFRERFFPQRSTAQGPQGMVTFPRFPELQEHLNNALRDAQGVCAGPGLGLTILGIF